MSRILLPLALLPILSAAQTAHFTSGPTQLEVDANGLTILYHGHEWIPDLARIPLRPGDCPAAPAMKDRPCLSDWRPVAWDELNEILYLAAATPTTRLILGYDLRSEQMNRVLENYQGDYDGSGAASPSGRYVVLVGDEVRGQCHSTPTLLILDTQNRQPIYYPVPAPASDETAQVVSLKWTGSSVVEYSSEVRSTAGCRAGLTNPPRKLTRSLDVPQLLNLATPATGSASHPQRP